MEFYSRKSTRLPKFDYNSPGYYFITVCTAEKRKILCEIVGTGLPDGPNVRFSVEGAIVRNRLEEMTNFYPDIKLDKYVVMPNHIHLMLYIPACGYEQTSTQLTNSKVSKFIGAFKRLTNRDCGKRLWQSRSHDHVIRNEQDYLKIWKYIDTNPHRWADDCFYIS